MNRKIQIALPSTGLEEWHATREPLETGWLTQGPKVAEFERQFAQLHNVSHALATTSCTTALHLILAALEIGPGDEVILPAFTWVATANVVLYCGATPVLADVCASTYNIDPEDVRRKLTPRTKAVIAVHLFGLCADMHALEAIVPSGIPIIEDAACAAGAAYKGVSAGALGLAAAFSFHPRKSVTTGEGGMVTTRDSELAARIEMLRNHGASVPEEQRHHGPRPYLLPDFNLLGFNYRMTDLQGAVGIVQLGKLRRFVAEREEWARFYMRELGELEWLTMPAVPSGGMHAWQSFVTSVEPRRSPLPRNQIMEHLQQRGISTRPGTHAIHMLGYYRNRFGYQPEDFPVARHCDGQTMAIPLHNRMSAEDFQCVVDALREIR